MQDFLLLVVLTVLFVALFLLIGSYLSSKIHWFFSFYIEFFKSLVDKEVNIGQKAYDFPKVSQAAFENYCTILFPTECYSPYDFSPN